MDKHFDNPEGQSAHLEVPPHHYMRTKTLESMRRRLVRLRQESARLNARPDADLDESTAQHLSSLRTSLLQLVNKDTLFAMRGLLKKLERDLLDQGLAPDEHIEWVFENLKTE